MALAAVKPVDPILPILPPTKNHAPHPHSRQTQPTITHSHTGKHPAAHTHSHTQTLTPDWTRDEWAELVALFNESSFRKLFLRLSMASLE